MKAFLKTYAADLAINMTAQVIVLFAGCFALLFGTYTQILWGLLAIGYSVILAKLMRGSVRKRGAKFKPYYAFVLLPPNIVALAVFCRCLLLPTNFERFIGVVVLLGSVSVTLIAVLVNLLVYGREES